MKRVTDAEWKVMEVVWESSPVAAQRIYSLLGAQEGWKPQTVKTLISRLVKKGALQFETEGNHYLYRPAIPREDAVAGETRSFLDRICSGSLLPILTQFAGTTRPLTDEEIQALRELLKQKGDTES